MRRVCLKGVKVGGIAHFDDLWRLYTNYTISQIKMQVELFREG